MDSSSFSMHRTEEKREKKKEDFFDLYFDYVWDNTESPRNYHRWCAIAGIGALLGRKCWIKHGHELIYPNQMIMLIGNPGTRKSTAINIIRRLMADAGYKKFAGSRTSKEKFLQDMADYSFDQTKQDIGGWNVDNTDMVLTEHEGDPSEVFICSGEFNSFIGHNNIEFLGLLGDLYDNPSSFDVRNKISKGGAICKPTLSILGGNTQQNFHSAFPPEVIGQGIMSRLLLIYAEKKYKDIAFPEEPSSELHDELVSLLAAIQMNISGPINITSDAKDLLAILYTDGSNISDPRFSYYDNRRFTHLLKLCINIAASRLKIEIDVEEVIYANTILTVAESQMPAALGEFGKARYSDLNNKIMSLLTEGNPGGYSVQEIFQKFHQDCDGPKQVGECLANLKMAGKVMPTGLLKFTVVKKRATSDAIVNLNLLREVTKEKEKEKEKEKIVLLRK